MVSFKAQTGILLLAIFVGVYAFAANQNQMDLEKRFLGKTASLFTAVDLDGNTIDLKKLQGKLVFLDFWATWCPPCRKEIPFLQEIYKKYSKQGLEMISINVNEDKTTVQTFCKNNPMPWRHILDEDGKVGKLYPSQYIPTPFLINPKGTIVAVGDLLRGKELQKTVEKYIKEVSQTEAGEKK